MSKGAKRDKRTISERELHKRFLKIWKRAQSDLCEVRNSEIHGRGVYATKDIAAEEQIIEYVGELIDKDESGRRGTAQQEYAQETGDAAVYIFNISKKYDLDGNFPWNTARLISSTWSQIPTESMSLKLRVRLHGCFTMHIIKQEMPST